MSLPRNVVIKMGGSTFGATDTTYEDIVRISEMGIAPIVVHGGGADVNTWLDKLGIEAEFSKGLRITNADTLEVAIAVLSGLLNKKIVTAIQRAGGNAVGISGLDHATIIAKINDQALGLVGTVEEVNPTLLRIIMEQGIIPVISPISLTSFPEHQIVNVNADTIAGEIANYLTSDLVIFLTDVPGVLNKDGKVISNIYSDEVDALIENKIIVGGMIPKVQASVRAIHNTQMAKIVDGLRPHALIEALDGKSGTTILRR